MPSVSPIEVIHLHSHKIIYKQQKQLFFNDGKSRSLMQRFPNLICFRQDT